MDPGQPESQTLPADAEYTFYQQVPLGSGRYPVRLVTVLPDGDTAPIRCFMEAADLDDHPSYETLSYCWGDDNSLHHITINGNRLHVTPNLHLALRHLRTKDSPRRLWVDKICINQSSIPERTAQVNIMKEIYASSLATIAWLGGDDVAMSSLIQDFFRSDCGRQDIELVSTASRLPPTTSSWLYRAKQTTRGIFLESGIDLVPQLNAVFQTAYFTRAWIVQEIAVSSKVTFQCASATAPLQSLLRAYQHCANHRSRYFHTDKAETAWHEVAVVLQLLYEVDFGSTSISLCSCLSYFRMNQASQEIDKIFAFYGLASREVHRLGLRPDYSLCNTDAYIEVAFSCLKELGDFTILQAPRGSSHLRHSLPSWVPDWSDSSRFGVGLSPETQALRRPLWQESLETQQSATPVGLLSIQASRHFTQRFHASRATTTAPIERGTSNDLCLQAMILDTATSLSAVLTSVNVTRSGWPNPLYENQRLGDTFAAIMAESRECERVMTILDTWRWKLRQHCGLTYVSDEPFVVAFIRTLCTDSVPLETPFDNIEQLIEEYEYFFPRTAGGELGESPDGFDFGRGMLRWLMHPRRAQRLLDTFKPLARRRFVLTSNGYFGLVPPETERGDAIVIPHGGSLPLVMRPNGSHFTLIGEAYIHGIMQGEAWKEDACKRIVIR